MYPRAAFLCPVSLPPWDLHGSSTRAFMSTLPSPLLPALLPCTRGVAHLITVTPPGFYTTAVATLECADGRYRSGWSAAVNASECDKCSPDNSVFSMATEILTMYKLDGTETSKTVKATVLSCCESTVWRGGDAGGPAMVGWFGWFGGWCFGCCGKLRHMCGVGVGVSSPVSESYVLADPSVVHW